MNTETDTPTPRTNKAFLDGYTFCKEDMMPAVAFASQLERELTAVTEQRDRLQKIVDEQCRVSSVCREYREQRDRLAEALEQILEYQGRFAEEDPESIAREALQSLKQPKKYDANEHQSFYP